MRWFDAIFPGAIVLVGLGLGPGARPLAAQVAPAPPQMSPPQTPLGSRSGAQGDNDDNNPMMRQLSGQQAMKRNDQRQKLIVDDTARLLTLAQQLKEEANKGSMSKSSVAFARKAEEIEKLAKAVKDKMREGQ
jgi:hypothetical protein